MPPPPPNFLPANRRRQHLDPTRHLQSRELWNQVRFQASASRYTTNNNARGDGSNNTSSSSSSSNSKQNAKWAISLLQALAYELQPFRIKPAYHRIKIFICEEEGLKKLSASLVEQSKTLFSFISKLLKASYELLQQIDTQSTKSFFANNKSLLTNSTAIIIALRIYYYILVYLHELLHIGPILVISTLLSLMYTVGLGDNTGAGSGIPSAYSVFNRGFKRILGTVDGEELARQYAGGMAMARAGGAMNNNNQNNGVDDEFEDGGVWVNEEEDGEEEEEENLVHERRRQRRLERLQQRRNEDGDGEVDVANEHDVQQPRDENAGNDMEEDDEDLADNENDGQPPTTNNETLAGRKSGKKARRRNLELRREMQRQRQAAAAMGFGAGVEGGGVDDGREMEARRALLE